MCVCLFVCVCPYVFGGKDENAVTTCDHSTLPLENNVAPWNAPMLRDTTRTKHYQTKTAVSFPKNVNSGRGPTVTSR